MRFFTAFGRENCGNTVGFFFEKADLHIAPVFRGAYSSKLVAIFENRVSSIFIFNLGTFLKSGHRRLVLGISPARCARRLGKKVRFLGNVHFGPQVCVV